MFRFITKRGFFVNLLFILLLFALLCFGILSALGYLTGHGKYANVPDVSGMNWPEAEKLLDQKGFRVEIQDSVWMPDMEPFAVVKQSPEANAVVKSNRKVFLTVNRQQPPLVEMPNLIGFTFRNANIFLKQLGLELGDTSRKPDIAKDAVLEQRFNGRPIAPGTKIFYGSQISFVLGSGLGDEEMTVPDLFGMRYSEALARLQEAGLNVGAVIPDFDVKDTLNAFVYKQMPEQKKKDAEGATIVNRIRVGQAIDLFLSVAVPSARAEVFEDVPVTEATKQEEEEQ